jgi:hypothetical protein
MRKCKQKLTTRQRCRLDHLKASEISGQKMNLWTKEQRLGVRSIYTAMMYRVKVA